MSKSPRWKRPRAADYDRQYHFVSPWLSPGVGINLTTMR